VRPLAIVGPTGTGKSQLALQIAERLGGAAGAEIVNADAMQFYRGMDIGTAKLPVAQRRGIPHHQLDVLDVTETATVARYKDAAAADIEAIASRGRVPVLVGGSMLYIQSLLDDWSFPTTDAAVRAKWERRLAEVGAERLHAELADRDPAAAASILPTDGRRIVRALEVVELTGQPFAASAPVIGTPRWDTVIIGLDCETERLDQRLARRTEAMFAAGLVDEVTRLLGCGLRDGVTASRALGYAQVIADGGIKFSGDVAKARISVIVVGFLGSFCFMVPIVVVHDLLTVAICLSMAFFFAELIVAPIWAIPMDITPEYSGSASGFMNFGFGVAGIISPVVFGYAIDLTGRWDVPFMGSLGVLLVGALLAPLCRPGDRFVDVRDDFRPILKTT